MTASPNTDVVVELMRLREVADAWMASGRETFVTVEMAQFYIAIHAALPQIDALLKAKDAEIERLKVASGKPIIDSVRRVVSDEGLNMKDSAIERIALAAGIAAFELHQGRIVLEWRERGCSPEPLYAAPPKPEPTAAWPTEEDVERVARSICAADGIDSESDVNTHAVITDHVPAWTDYRPHARAALAVVAPPKSTEELVAGERDRLYQIMKNHVMTLPIGQRGAWLKPMSVVRRGRFLTPDEKLTNLANGLGVDVSKLRKTLNEDHSLLERAPAREAGR